MKRKKKKTYKKWLTTFTKKAVTAILVLSLFDMQLSYLLAFMGYEQIAETLSSSIAEMIIGTMIGYFFKALFETFFEKREKRLNNQSDTDEEVEVEEAEEDNSEAVG